MEPACTPSSRFTATIVILTLVSLATATLPAAEPEAIKFIELTPQAEKAVEKGLRYLAATQNSDGSWDSRHHGRDTAIAALAILGFMARGNSPGRGEYGATVARGLDYIMRSARPNGVLCRPKPDCSHGPMYSHGFCTLALGEAWGMTKRSDLKTRFKQAVDLICKTQNKDGGWRYHPVPDEADISVTIVQLMALRAANNAGIAVPTSVIERAIRYVKACAHKDGGFRYTNHRWGGSGPARTAAGVVSLQVAGDYEAEQITPGLEYLLRAKNDEKVRWRHYFYGHYYAAQAAYQAGGKYWEEWYPWIREEFIKKQDKDGSWASGYGSNYATAMALLVLCVPYRYLPIYQR